MHPFIEEAGTQGNILTDCLDFYFSQENQALEKVCDLFKSKTYSKIIFSGMGSSYYAPFSAAGFLTQNNIPSIVINAAELANYQLNLIQDDTLLVLVSQSGESAEIVDVINKVKGRAAIVAVVNNSESTLAKESDIQLSIHAGYEKFISSKSYLNTVAVLQILSAALLGKMDEGFKGQMYEAADWVRNYLSAASERREEIMAFIKDTDIFDFLGNGPSASTAFQSGLIFREGPQYPTCTSLCAEYAHGWNLLTKEGSTVVIFDPFRERGSSLEAMRKFVLENGGKVILITSGEMENCESILTIQHPKLPEHLAPLMQIIPCTMIMGWLLEVKER